MADPVAISVSMQDFSGKRKSAVFFGDPTLTVAQAQTAYETLAPKLDAVSDAKIIAAHVTLPLTPEGTEKSAAIDGNRVREGALVGYSADGTSHRWGQYIPGWKNAGFSGDVVLNTGAYATMISEMLNWSDDNARALLGYLDGVRTFRK